jgi:hypothetical protein
MHDVSEVREKPIARPAAATAAIECDLFFKNDPLRIDTA